MLQYLFVQAGGVGALWGSGMMGNFGVKRLAQVAGIEPFYSQNWSRNLPKKCKKYGQSIDIDSIYSEKNVFFSKKCNFVETLKEWLHRSNNSSEILICLKPNVMKKVSGWEPLPDFGVWIHRGVSIPAVVGSSSFFCFCFGPISRVTSCAEYCCIGFLLSLEALRKWTIWKSNQNCWIERF